jgi:hypothetical protein
MIAIRLDVSRGKNPTLGGFSKIVGRKWIKLNILFIK